MIDHINQTRARHIVTLEDPIEYLHPDKRSIVNQREVGSDTESFGRAMRRVLRQDPDVILIGEMRDEETVRTALSAAETGHLVLSTVHTLDATETINRIIDFFPPHLQQQARVMLAATLKGAIAQRLVPDVTGEGRVPASEVLVVTGRVQDLILNPEETGKITEVIAEGEYYGMRTFDQSLLGYVMEGRITERGGARVRLQPARLQADARRRRAAGERASSSSRRAAGAGWRIVREQAERRTRWPRWRRSLPAVRRRRGLLMLDPRAARRRKKPPAGKPRPTVNRRSPATRSSAAPATAVEARRDRSRSRPAVAGPGAASAAPRSRRRRCRLRSPPPTQAGKTVVLLVVHDGGIDDRLVGRLDGAARSLPDVGDLHRPGEADRPLRGDHRSASASTRCRRWS